ncbi:MAG: tRNA pseudouridine(38-40) synthase TruA [Sphingomicrobium sp.]
MTRWRLTIEYDGGPFFGWQRQNDAPTVQKAIDDAIGQMTGEENRVHCAGRTDTGVHGLAMTAHVDIAKPMTAFRLREAINALVRPNPITILEAEEVADDWHARFSCKERRYLYRILNRRPPPALDRGRVWHLARPIDIDAMVEGARHLIGRHDFTTFRSVHCQSDSPIKTLDLLTVKGVGGEIHLRTAARSFLHHQVRSMTGCLALVGLGRWKPNDIRVALEARDRNALGLNAPPHGLYFVEAIYP